MRIVTAKRILSACLFIASAASFAAAAEKAVDLTASDGAKLKASYFPAARPGPGVLLLHQCNRDRKIWDPLAQQLSAAGLNVLTLDMRGFGESEGVRLNKATPEEAQALQAKWPGDIDIAFQYLESQSGVSRDVIGVGGASCGVNNSVQTAIRHPEVRSLVLLSGTTDAAGRKFLRNSTSPPEFFAAADDDEFPATVIAIEWLYSSAANPGKKLVRYKTGGHGADMFAVHPELMGQITDWYVTTLLKTPGKAPVAKESAAVSPDVKMLMQLDEPGGPALVEAKLKAAREHDPNATLFREDLVNLLGYEHLQAGDVKGAIEILKLNAVAFPNSANAYDSLGDAYLADGQTDLARVNAKKALELLPSDTTDNQQRRDGIKASAEQKLKQLGDSAQ
jgi:dienelactone hydrolase